LDLKFVLNFNCIKDFLGGNFILIEIEIDIQ